MKKKPERRVIYLKQSKHVSPIKQSISKTEYPFPSSSPFTHQQQTKIPHIAPQSKLSENQLNSISNNADSLISIELMRAILQKQSKELSSFFEKCPPIFQKAFESVERQVRESLSSVKQQRLQRLKQQNVVFVPPNKDYFEQQKGKTLNNCIKQHIELNQSKHSISQQKLQQYYPLFNKIADKIKHKSEIIPKQCVEPKYQRMVNQLKEYNEERLISKKKQVKANLLQLLDVSSQMMKLKVKEIQNREKNDRNMDHKIGKYNGMNPQDKLYQHKLILLKPQDYLS